jgi:hypothetical protein
MCTGPLVTPHPAVPHSLFCCPAAPGFHQWKALLTLLLRCTSAMTAPATSPLLADLLATLTAQLALATAGTAAAAAGGPSEAQLAGEGGGPPLAAVLVEELLPGSFLKQLLGGLVAWVREEGPAVPPGVRQQVRPAVCMPAPCPTVVPACLVATAAGKVVPDDGPCT